MPDELTQALAADQTEATTVTIGGEEYEITVRIPKTGELEAIDEELPEDASEGQVAQAVAERFIQEELPDRMPVTRAITLQTAVMETIQSSEAFEEAREQLQLEGNG
jgi:hypothetical protein